MIKRKFKKKRKNPYSSKNEIINHLLKNNNVVHFNEIGKGGSAIVYLFELFANSVIFDNVLLKKGKYALKIIIPKVLYLNEKQIKYLILLSKYGLIPKIYYINKNITIMDYIKGMSYFEFVNKYPEKKEEIDDKITKLMRIWNNLGFNHDDLSHDNILIMKNLKVYFIDPSIIDMYDEKQLYEIQNTEW